MPGPKSAAPQGSRKSPPRIERLETAPVEPSMEDTDEDIDVWPSIDVLEEEAKEMPVEESGLSVDPEDLGRQWLNQATEQGNFESTRGEHDAGMHVIRLPTKTPE